MKVITINPMATHLVILASLASQLLALFLDRKVSAPPAMAPDSPALFPDWSSTTATRNSADNAQNQLCDLHVTSSFPPLEGRFAAILGRKDTAPLQTWLLS